MIQNIFSKTTLTIIALTSVTIHAMNQQEKIDELFETTRNNAEQHEFFARELEKINKESVQPNIPLITEIMLLDLDIQKLSYCAEMLRTECAYRKLNYDTCYKKIKELLKKTTQMRVNNIKKLLDQNNASIQAVNKDFKKPLDLAVELQLPIVVKLLLEKDKNINRSTLEVLSYLSAKKNKEDRKKKFAYDKKRRPLRECLQLIEKKISSMPNIIHNDEGEASEESEEEEWDYGTPTCIHQ